MSSWTSSPLPLNTQVGGHTGSLTTTDDRSLIIKTALPLELKFYQTHASSSALEPLHPFLPKFYGTLKLEGVVDESNSDSLVVTPIAEAPEHHKESLVLENLAYSFSKPNILDIKLGTILYDESATPEKRERMENIARITTSLETGIRLTGFQVHDNNTSEPVVTPKAYGKSIKASDLPDGIARFFPIASTASPSTGPPPTTALGLPRSILLHILESLREDIDEMLEAFQEVELRMVGASLLIIYEGDWERAAEGVKLFGLDESGLEDAAEDEQGQDVENGDEEDEEDEEDEDDEDKKRPGPPYTINLIDFAHTRIAPNQGPDQGVLLGLSTVRKLLDGRIEQVRNVEV